MGKLRSFSIILLILFVLGKPNNLCFAQAGGKIVGIVIDEQTGEPLVGANILLEGTMLGAATDEDGYYMILRIAPGKYTVSARYLGYQKVIVKEVEVLTNLTTRLDFNLRSEVLESGDVIIVAEEPLVRKDLTSSEARIQADRIERMPVREVDDILNLQAGITRDVDGDLHIRGGRSSEIAYLVNGISVTDDYSREQALTVGNESVQELQVISGTFNAEYGNAMSGVINIVTKTGDNQLSGKFEAWTGDYLSSRKDIFWNIDDINPTAEYNIQGTVSGPVIRDRITFFATARRIKNEGWLCGPDAYSPQGRSQIVNGEVVSVRGDSSAVPMNQKERWSGQGALKWNILKPLTLKIDYLGSIYKDHWYDHDYRLNPKGMRYAKGYGIAIINKLTHVLIPSTFYELTVSYKENENKERLYSNTHDSRYVHPDSLTAGANSFFKAGTDLFRSFRSTKSLIGKLELTSQVTKKHQLKTGIEVQQDKIDFEDITLVPARDENGLQIEPFRPYIEELYSANHNLFKREPDKFAFYIQDKIEYDNVVINIGLRYDYFNANGKIPADPQDPNIYNPQRLNHIYKDSNGDGAISISEQTEVNKFSLEERKSFWYKDTRAKTQLSPRFGIAYPITGKGIIHFSYGIFQQIPEYSQLYEEDELKLSEGQGIWGPYGNPDLNPQRTTMYELGLKQEVFENIAIDVTGYYRDIRDWISSSAAIRTYVTGVTYSKMINRDYANVKGITFTVSRRLKNNFSFDLDYTFQIAQGTNSSPEDEYDALNAGAEPRKQLSALDWDQNHGLNTTIFIGENSWGFNIITRFNSGQPYTPEIPAGTLTGQNILPGLATNIRQKPNRFTVDLNAFKKFSYKKLHYELFLRIYNLFDSKNPVDVFTDSGKADFTIYQTQEIEADPTYFIRPDYYSEPRSVHIGIKVAL